MNLEEFNERTNELETESYRAIRRKISDFSDESNNDELAGFVKGVVVLQSLLYGNMERELVR